jgi:hypothetical protein
LISLDTGDGLVFYIKLKVKGNLKYEFLGTGLARVAAGKTIAVRDQGLLFNAPEPTFSEALVDGDLLYLYGNLSTSDASGQVAVACVPLAQATTRLAYLFWNGTAWVKDVNQVKPVLTVVPGSLSVSFNPYLENYLAVHSETLSNRVVLQVASSPQGPWSQPIVLFIGDMPVSSTVDYAGREHPELATKSGRNIVVSYYQPLGGFNGELRLVQVTFK